MPKNTITMLCLVAAALLSSSHSGRAAEKTRELSGSGLRQDAVDLNLGDAGGHSQILYNEMNSAQPIDTALVRESISGISEALESARRDFELLEQEALAGSDQTKIKIYRKIRQYYDRAGKNLDGLKAEFAKPAADNNKMTSLTKSIFADLKDARKELAKVNKQQLLQPPME